MRVDKRKKPATAFKQDETLRKVLLWYADAVNNDDDNVRVNCLEYLSNDYLRNFYDDEHFEVILYSIHMFHYLLDEDKDY